MNMCKSWPWYKCTCMLLASSHACLLVVAFPHSSAAVWSQTCRKQGSNSDAYRYWSPLCRWKWRQHRPALLISPGRSLLSPPLKGSLHNLRRIADLISLGHLVSLQQYSAFHAQAGIISVEPLCPEVGTVVNSKISREPRSAARELFLQRGTRSDQPLAWIANGSLQCLEGLP